MSGYTKADFYAAYSQYATDSAGRVFNNFCDNSVRAVSSERLTLRLHYHPSNFKSVSKGNAQDLSEHIDSNDVVAVIGCAFNWTGEELEEILGCDVYGVDPSEWVQTAKYESPNTDLIASIEAQGYVANSPEWQYLFDAFDDPNPRSSAPEKIFRTFEEIPTSVTKIVTEEVWQIMPEETKEYYRSLNLPMIHLIDREVIVD